MLPSTNAQGDIKKGKRKTYKKEKQPEGTPAQVKHNDAVSETPEQTMQTNSITGVLPWKIGTGQRGDTMTIGCSETGPPLLLTQEEEERNSERAQGGEGGGGEAVTDTGPPGCNETDGWFSRMERRDL